MLFEIIKNTDLLLGTHYQNSIVIEYNKLIKLFGEPIEFEEDEKTRAEWIIKWEDSVITSIYDYKSNYIPVTDVTDWHIGGLNKKAVNYLYEHIRLNSNK